MSVSSATAAGVRWFAMLKMSNVRKIRTIVCGMWSRVGRRVGVSFVVSGWPASVALRARRVVGRAKVARSLRVKRRMVWMCVGRWTR